MALVVPHTLNSNTITNSISNTIELLLLLTYFSTQIQMYCDFNEMRWFH